MPPNLHSAPKARPWLALFRVAAPLVVLALLALPRPALCQSNATVALTPAERAYLSQHPVVPLCVDPDWVPFERINEAGEHDGISADLLALVAKRTGLRFELLRTKDWKQSLHAAETGQCKVLSFLNTTREREQWLRFTEPLLSDPNVLITREEHPYIADLAGLTGQSIVLPKGTSVEERVRRDYPNLTVLTTETEPETMNMVSGRKADLTLRSLIVAAYTIRKEGLFNLKIAGQVPEYANKLRVGVVRSEPLLRDILDKGVRTITPQEREQIINRHVTINVQMGTDYALLFKLLGALLAVAGIGLFWTLRLRRLNAELKRLSETDQLTGLYNRARLDSEYRVEFERAQRYARPLSLIMLDIDHFKRVNDELGHLSGDKVLVTVASIALLSIRNTDVLGRWGGEEFLVLCPEAGTADALVVAERIRAAVEGGSFPNGRRVSISAGVGTLVPGDTTDSLLQRADAAMYAAKNSGRNRVCS